MPCCHSKSIHLKLKTWERCTDTRRLCKDIVTLGQLFLFFQDVSHLTYCSCPEMISGLLFKQYKEKFELGAVLHPTVQDHDKCIESYPLKSLNYMIWTGYVVICNWFVGQYLLFWRTCHFWWLESLCLVSFKIPYNDRRLSFGKTVAWTSIFERKVFWDKTFTLFIF